MKDGADEENSPALDEKSRLIYKVTNAPERRQRRSRRWLYITNVIIVSIIIFDIASIISNLCRKHPHQLSEDEAERIMLDSPSPGFIRNQSNIYTSGPISPARIILKLFIQEIYGSHLGSIQISRNMRSYSTIQFPIVLLSMKIKR